MECLNRADLLRKEELKTEKVDLTDGEFVFVRQMTGRERDRFEQSLRKEVKTKEGIDFETSMEDFRAKLAVNTLCDEEGNNLLQPEDYDLLSQNMSAARLEEIINKAQELNKISNKDKDALVKNSEADQKGADTSE